MSELAVGSLAGLAANSYVIDVASGSQLTQPGMVLQVVSTTKTDAFSTTSTSFTDVTGLSATITPSSTNSKILVIVNTNISSSDENQLARLVRDTTAIGSGTSGSSLNGISFITSDIPVRYQSSPIGFNYLDSPNTTSSITYKIQVTLAGAGTLYVNRRSLDASFGVSSSITLMEIAG